MNDSYQHREVPFGEFTAHEISDAGQGDLFRLVPSFGAHLLQLRLKGVEVLDGPGSPGELRMNRWAKGSFLFPFPNRLKGGTYQWEGQTYQFPVNDAQNEAALHGFGREFPYEVSGVRADRSQGVISCKTGYDGSLPYYPFPFELELEFELTPEGGLQISFAAKNTGKATLPFGFGWHPYFSLSAKVEDMELTLPDCMLVATDDRMIPTGKKYGYDTFSSPRKIGAEVLDNCFFLPDTDEDKAYILLKGEKGKLTCWQERDAFPYFQLFTPFGRTSLAVEPMSCNIDAFNNGERLRKLEPGEVFSGNFGVRFP